jgi:rod shape-determining protein MreC
MGRSLSRSDTLLLVICLALSLIALALPGSWTAIFTSGVRATALAPLIWLQSNAEQQRTSRLRLRDITAARDSAALAAQSLASLRSENDQLRQLLGLRGRVRYPTVPAEVLHQTMPTDGRSLLLGAGSNAGVTSGSPVVSPYGLVGLVTSVSPGSSVAMTWADPDFRASAVTEDGNALGLVAPAPSSDASEAFLELRGIPYRDTVSVGTLVMTSGLAGVYPRGIPIGRVAGVQREELGWERVYRLTPLANPGFVSHVLIYLTAPAPQVAPSAADPRR